MSQHLVGAVLLFGLMVLLATLALRPLSHERADDEGDGLASVVLPKPRSVSLSRVGIFYLLSCIAVGLLVAPQAGPSHYYKLIVGRAALLVYDNPQLVLAYSDHLSVTLRLVVLANLIAFTLTIRASPMRRIALISNAVVFLGIVICLDVFGAVLSALVRLPTQTASLFGSLLILVVAIVMVLRIIATTFMVPRPTVVPDLRVHHRAENVLFVTSGVVAVVVVIAMVDLADTLLGLYHPTAFLIVFIGFPLLFNVMFVFLLISTRRIRPPHDPEHRPPITTITPAFNEQSTIARTLESLDEAARHYRGEVTVILTDDGSNDATVQVASEVMGRFRFARGRLIRAAHGGKAAALNKALSLAESEIVTRVDADVTVAPDALVYLPDWFKNPSIGMVGALALPDPRARSWYARGRLFECLIGFSFARVALQRVDAINCIPGTFTAFRRGPARYAGGFVSGMNGEDSDLTMILGRLGYQVAIDTRIRTYEDVPKNLREFREQRVRWSRAGVHILSRHSPLRAGGGSPRSWFFFLRAAAVRVTAVLRPLVFVTGLELALLDPSTRQLAPRIFVFYAVAAVPTLFIIALRAVRLGFWRELPWLFVWYPFTLVRRMVVLEGLLTLPTRPVRLTDVLGSRSPRRLTSTGTAVPAAQ
ncbi:MAG: glycosyltransferase family 2 protein [Acidimicrobiales bacterium]